MIVRVASALSQPVLAVAGQPYALTLWTFGRLREIERFREINTMGDRLHLASLTAFAYHEPKKLSQEHQRFERLAGLLPSIEETKAKGLAILNADRAARGLPPLTEL